MKLTTAILLFAAFAMGGVSVEAQNQLPQTETTQQILRAIELANENPQPRGVRGPSMKEIDSGRAYRVAYCQQNPAGFVTVPNGENGEKITCVEELARVKAFCTVSDPKFKKLLSCRTFAKKEHTP